MIRMSILIWTIVVVASSGVLAHEKPVPSRSTIKKNPNTVLVLFGTRHGNRNPEKFVDVPNRTWGKEGELELTSIGKRQAYGLGKEMRKYLGVKFVDENYSPSEAKFYSSSANRCQMTLQSVLAGLYTPTAWADWNTPLLDNWSPVPYTIDDPLLRMYSVKTCGNSDKAWDPISNDHLDDLVALKKNSKDILDYMQKKDGRNATISNAADIADNIINMDFYNSSYPDWLEKPTLPGYDKKKMRAAFLAFAENHMNRCASYKPCRNMMGGYWANHIMQGVKLIGYASHTEVTLATMIILGIEKEELTTSAGFVIEVKKVSVGTMVRLLLHDPHPIDEHVIHRAKLVPALNSKIDKHGWMPFSTLKEYLKDTAFSDWEGACGIVKCSQK